jgi:phosphohistidine phosphatase
MDLLIIRHAEAEEFSIEGDVARALTRAGTRKMHLAAQGLAQSVAHIDLLAHSPLVRAHQTAQVLADYYDAARLLELALLAPGVDAGALTQWLGKQPPEAVIAIIGHEPDLSGLISWWCAGREDGFVKMKKGAVCRLSFAAAPARSEATLHWLVTASQFVRMAG